MDNTPPAHPYSDSVASGTAAPSPEGASVGLGRGVMKASSFDCLVFSPALTPSPGENVRFPYVWGFPGLLRGVPKMELSAELSRAHAAISERVLLLHCRGFRCLSAGAGAAAVEGSMAGWLAMEDSWE